MLNVNRLISPYNHYDYNNPKYLVFHYVGAQSSTAKNNAVYFNGGDRQASAHYFVDDTEIWQSVEDTCGAWSVGNTRTEVNNQNSINIEMCCMASGLTVTETTEKNAIELAAYLMKKYNIPMANVRTHYEVTAGSKLCPNFANTSRWSNLKNKLSAALNASNTVSNATVITDNIYRVKLANGEQIGAFKSLDNAKNLAQTNKCNVYDKNNNLVVSYLPNSDVASKVINYRVKRKNGEQLGAFRSLDNAEALAKKEQAIIYDANGNVVKSYVPDAGLGYLNLHPHMQSWKVYAVDGPYTVNYAIASLAPAQYGGLSYKIYEKKATDVYKIKTEMYGYVAIYAPRDADSTITTTNPMY